MTTAFNESNNRTICNSEYQAFGQSTTITALLTLFTVLGFIANLITLVILIIYKTEFPDIGRTLLKNQAIADSLVCVMAVGLFVQEFRWTSGFKEFDFLLCQAWHSQAIFWGCVLVSIWNLVFIAADRLVKISYPFKYRCIQQSHIYITFAFIILLCVLCSVPCYFQARYDYEDGKCKDQYYFLSEKFSLLMAYYGKFWFAVGYVIPTTCFIILYTKIIWGLRKLNKSSQKMRHLNRLKQRKICTLTIADKELTKTSIIVTAVFFITMSAENWRYFLGRIGIICYEKNTFQLIFGVFLASINSCANPFIYAISLPCFQRSLKRISKFSND